MKESLLSYKLVLEFYQKSKSQELSSLKFKHYFRNNGDKTLYLSTYKSPFFIRSIEPKSLFHIHRPEHHPSTKAGAFGPPKAREILEIGAKQEAIYEQEQWLDALELNYDRHDQWRRYDFKKSGNVTLRVCYNSNDLDEKTHSPLLPPGESLWKGEICAPETSFTFKK